MFGGLTKHGVVEDRLAVQTTDRSCWKWSMKFDRAESVSDRFNITIARSVPLRGSRRWSSSLSDQLTQFLTIGLERPKQWACANFVAWLSCLRNFACGTDYDHFCEYCVSSNVSAWSGMGVLSSELAAHPECISKCPQMASVSNSLW